MNFPFYIARRYILAKKSHNAINVVAIVSVAAVLICSAGAIIILSVFNGFDTLVQSMYSSFYSDLRIEPVYGKVFSPDTIPMQKILKLEGIKEVATTVEENVLVSYDDRQWPGKVRGVSQNYHRVTSLDSMVYDGEYRINEDRPEAIVGRGVSQNLGVLIKGTAFFEMIVPKRNVQYSSNVQKLINRKRIRAAGKFSVQPEIDNSYILVPLGFAQRLFDYSNELSSIEILVDEHTNIKRVKRQLESMLGSQYIIKNKIQQNELLFKTMQSEKMAIFVILAFILIIASFNLVGSISMLIIEKQDDIKTLRDMGATRKRIKHIYFFEGFLIAFTGMVIGLFIGLLVCWVQQQFGLVKLKGMFVIDAYPVRVEGLDFLIVFLIVGSIGFLSSLYPVNKLIKRGV